MIKRISLTLFIFMILGGSILTASELDELDKPPEGAHEGQILVGGVVTIGGILGGISREEHDFLKGCYYIFPDSGQAKALWISHISFSYGISGEYMFIDHLGAKLWMRRSYVVQRTVFGADYENWSESLYKDFSFYLGPSVHLTTRRVWDVTFCPYIGFYTGKFQATPVAKKILVDYSDDSTFAGISEKTVNGFTMGTELAFTVYFSGGLYISLGVDWTMSMMDFGGAINLTNEQKSSLIYRMDSSAALHTMSLVLSAGYAFYN